MLKDLYSGFYLTKPCGNNAFSFAQRSLKKLYVPAIKETGLEDLKKGEKIVFAEVYEGVEKNLCGLENYLYFNYQNKPIFVFDNHNHAFFFWVWAYHKELIGLNNVLVHVDQHKDMREPDNYIDAEKLNNLKDVFSYTNDVLNVGNFIKPALHTQLVSDIVMIDQMDAFEVQLPAEYILDIDIDIFSKDMKYIDDEYKFKKIRSYVENAKIITVATSPYFIDQSDAIQWVKRIFD